MSYDPVIYRNWYLKNRSKLLLIRKKYNQEYSARPEVIEWAKIRNARPKRKEVRKMYKKSKKGKEANKRYAEKNKGKIRKLAWNWRLKTRYGITECQFNDLLKKQNGQCVICLEAKQRLHIDHCHKTGKIRGLLCGSCNRALGLFKDNTEFLIKAIKYLNAI